MAKTLTKSDLLKNLLIKNVPVGLQEDRANKWDLNLIENTTEKGLLNFLILEWWLINNKKNTESTLYRDIEVSEYNKDDNLDLIDRLIKNSQLYKNILENDYSGFKNGDEIERKTTLIRKVFSISQVDIILFYVLEHKNNENKNNEDGYFEDKVLEILERIIDYCFITIKILGMPANELEKRLSHVFKDINNIRFDDFYEIVIDELKVDPAAWKRAELQLTQINKKNNYWKPILHWIFYKTNTATSINIKSELEHILPQKYNKWKKSEEYSDLNEEKMEKLVYSIGNCMLLSKKVNGNIGNKSFIKKEIK